MEQKQGNGPDALRSLNDRIHSVRSELDELSKQISAHLGDAPEPEAITDDQEP